MHKRGPFWDGNTAAELLKQVGYMPKQYVLCFNISKPLHIFFPLVWLLHKEAEERKRIYGAIPAAVQSGCTKIKYSLAGCRMSESTGRVMFASCGLQLSGTQGFMPSRAHKVWSSAGSHELSDGAGSEGAWEAQPGQVGPGDSFSDRDDLDLDEALLQAAAEKKAVSREKSKLEVEARKTMFVHVRLNRVHCRVTYQVTLVLLKGYGPLIIPFFFLILPSFCQMLLVHVCVKGMHRCVSYQVICKKF